MANNAQPVSITAPDVVDPGQSFTAVVTMTNSGTTTWTSGGNYRLGSESPRDNIRWMATNRVPLPNNVSPGQTVQFSFGCVAPAQGGPLPFAWGMVQDQVEWFGGVASKTITVNPPPPPPPPQFPAPRFAPTDPVSCQVFNTGPYRVGGGYQYLYWQNQSDRPLRIVKAYLWTGVDLNGIADVHVEVRREIDNTLLCMKQWDHYQNPIDDAGRVFDFSATPIILLPGERLKMLYFANPAGAANFNAHHVCELWAL